MNNPLCEPIFQLLVDKKQFKITTLFEALQHLDALALLDENENKALFKKNFLIMNALYQLQEQLLQEQWYLHISTLHIAIEPYLKQSLSELDSLKNYYLDWSNYDTSLAEIDALLNRFWQYYARTQPALDDQHTLAQLSPLWCLPHDATFTMLQKRWRVLALQYHPDRPDGHLDTFQRLESEYQVLKRFVANSTY